MAQGRLWTVLGVSESGKPGRIVIWDTAEVTLGRSPENDIMVDDTDASRKHAIFVRSSAGYQIQDLGTSNGTFVNGERIIEPHTLSNKDVVKICELQIQFIETRKDPGGLGLEVSYASQLKGFASGPPASADPGTTTLGLLDQVSGPFNVGAVNDYTAQPAPVEPVEPKDLDLEFADFGPGGPGSPSPANADGRLSLHLELEGLSPDLQRTLESLFGKVLDLPAMRVRIKSDDGL
jgi:pSer/pThr/pTyr-binding forkhead associated (FHA) protein